VKGCLIPNFINFWDCLVENEGDSFITPKGRTFKVVRLYQWPRMIQCPISTVRLHEWQWCLQCHISESDLSNVISALLGYIVNCDQSDVTSALLGYISDSDIYTVWCMTLIRVDRNNVQAKGVMQGYRNIITCMGKCRGNRHTVRGKTSPPVHHRCTYCLKVL
jgi:hypothetical protein